MMPGPMMASTALMRAQRRSPGRRRVWAAPPDAAAVARAPAPGSPMEHLFQHVVHRDDAEQLARLVLDRQGEEVVLGGELGDLPGRVVRQEGSWVLVHEREHVRFGLR